MPIIETHNLKPGIHPYSQQIYNGLDTCLTWEVHRELLSIHNETPLTYKFERALQGPVLEMMLRGFRVDEYERQKSIKELQALIARLDSILQRFAFAVWGKTLNPQSPKQLLSFFYETMKLPEVWSSKKGIKKLSTDREALEKLSVYFHATPIINCILAIRDYKKQLSVLETEIDPDGRMRTSYNIAGTETGRFSSSQSAFGTGTNLQNLKRDDDISEGKLSLRKLFISDEGYRLCGIDLEQAESREVGWLCGILFGDWSYLDACYSGDLHTLVCRYAWPERPWTDDPKANRKLADELFYRNYSYRDMAKKLGHGCLTADHEVLTPTGWVSIAEKPTEIMEWHPTGSRFVRPSNWIDKKWNGELISVEGTSVSLLATPDHRILYSKNGINGQIHEAPAEKFPRVGGIPLGGKYLGGPYYVSPDEARLIAAYQCDGWRSSGNCIAFHMKKTRKFMRLEMLALKAGCVNFRKSRDKAYITGGYDYSWWPKYAGAYLLQWSIDAIRAYIDEHKHWDGHQSETAVMISSVNREHLEWLQTIGRLCGIGGNFQKTYTSGFGSSVHRLQQNNRKLASISSLKISRVQNNTRVYCPTVHSGAFYVRRNGKISVTGNSNYYGQPFTMARHAKIPQRMVEIFQDKYFSMFPGIPKWHRWVAEQLQTTQQITTIFGRTRHFFGRPNDDTTLREAIAFGPQSSTADRMNLGLWRIWKYLGTRVQLIAQVHDAVYFQIPESEDYQELVQKALSLIDIRIKHDERELIVPGEPKLGWNWGTYHETFNPNGLKKFKLGSPDPRKRLVGLERPV